MTLVASPAAGAARGSLDRAARILSSRRLGAVLLTLAVASQALSHQDGDNSWLFTVAEKVLSGDRAYVDVVESNPPAAFLFYMPAVVAAHALRVSVECAAVAFVLACAGASIALAARVLRRAGLLPERARGFLRNAAIFALVLLPGFSFAEREHIACLFVVPLLAVYAARAASAPVGRADAIAAGLCGACAAAMKPYFGLSAALPFAFALWRSRRLALVWAPEQIAAVVGLAAQAAIVVVVFPDYLTLAPVLLDLYAPMREPLRYCLVESWFLLNLALFGALYVGFGARRLPATATTAALGSIGFLFAYLIQGKGWVNHGLPGVELAFGAAALALAPVLMPAGGVDAAAWARARRAVLFVFLPAVIGAPVLFGVFLPLGGFEEHKGLAAAVLRHAPPHPKIIALSPHLDAGHPLTRQVGGEWVGRPNAIWRLIFAQMLLEAGVGDPAWRARLEAYRERDAQDFREDVARGRPDVVLVLQDPRIAEAMRDPDIAAAMRDYAPVETADDVAVWIRAR